MSIPIQNGNSFLLTESNGNVPDMSGALQGWMQPMTFVKIAKSVVNAQLVEVPTVVDFQGVWQPLTARQLSMKPEGQRAWSWFQVHSTINLELKPDEVVRYKGGQYRAKGQSDFKLYGYFYYELVQDFTGSGP